MFIHFNFSFHREMNTFQKSKEWISDLSYLRRHFAYSMVLMYNAILLFGYGEKV